MGEQPNAPKRLDSHELNSHKHGQTCAHRRAHPPPCPALHTVTQHIQGLLFIAGDEPLHEWPFMPLSAIRGTHEERDL